LLEFYAHEVEDGEGEGGEGKGRRNVNVNVDGGATTAPSSSPSLASLPPIPPRDFTPRLAPGVSLERLQEGEATLSRGECVCLCVCVGWVYDWRERGGSV
jgi:hypothetical protein